MKRRFELKSSKSAKFWEIEQKGATCTVRFGRIGSKGQTKVKTLPTSDDAAAESQKLVRQKTSKGYIEVGKPPRTAIPSSSTDEDLPFIAWTKAAKADRHPRRGHATVFDSVSDPKSLYKPLHEEYKTLHRRWHSHYLHVDEEITPLRKRVHDVMMLPLKKGAQQILELEGEAARATVLRAHSWEPHESLPAALLGYWIRMGGPSFAVRALAKTWIYDNPDRYLHVIDRSKRYEYSVCPKLTIKKEWKGDPDWLGNWWALRCYLACADGAVYAEARDVARALRRDAKESSQPSVLLRCALSYAFPDETKWVEQDAKTVLEMEPPPEWLRYTRLHVWALLASLRHSVLAEKLVERALEWAYAPALGMLIPSLLDGLGLKAVGALKRIAESGLKSDVVQPAVKALVRVRSPESANWFADNIANERFARSSRDYLIKNPRLAVASLAKCKSRGGGNQRTVSDLLDRILSAHPSTRENAFPPLSPKLAKLVMVSSPGRDASGSSNEVQLEELPLELRPSKKVRKAMPIFWDAGRFPRPLLESSRKPLSLEALSALGNLMRNASIDRPRTQEETRLRAEVKKGFRVIKELCEPSSLSEFAWGVLSSWLDMGAPSREKWPLIALAFLGDRETVDRLSRVMKTWPTQRAVVALEVLEAMNNRSAHSVIHRIAESSKSRSLRKQAEAILDQIAEKQGVSRRHLAVELIPDLGLDSSGRRVLDYGTRRFFVSFDQEMKPFLKDEKGKRLGRLPRPRKTDDARLAEEAKDIWKWFVAESAHIIGAQVARLEESMCTRYFWRASQFRSLSRHPLVRHLAEKIIWGVKTKRSRREFQTFRLAEDGTLTDVNDDALDLAGDHVFIPHAVDIPADTLKAWTERLADYKIIQPFEQILRPFYRPSPEESESDVLLRYQGMPMSRGRIWQLVRRGWRIPGRVGEGGESRGRCVKEAGRYDLQIDLLFEGREKTHVEKVLLVQDSRECWRFSDLDPIDFSELVRDLEYCRV